MGMLALMPIAFMVAGWLDASSPPTPAAIPTPSATSTAATTATVIDGRATRRSPAMRTVSTTIHVMLIIPSA
jgi:hypothetical protein